MHTNYVFLYKKKREKLKDSFPFALFIDEIFVNQMNRDYAITGRT